MFNIQYYFWAKQARMCFSEKAPKTHISVSDQTIYSHFNRFVCRDPSNKQHIL